MNKIKLNLIVLRVANLEDSVKFYESLGLTFIKEQHESGPIHYASSVNDMVIELYPATSNYPVEKSLRLGFEVTDINKIIEELELKNHHDEYLNKNNLIVIKDPDGRKIQIQKIIK